MSATRWAAVDEFLLDHLVPEASEMEGVLQANADADLPEIDVSAAQGKYLQLLVRISGAERVLEIGTLGGYSTIWMARGLPSEGRLLTLELEPAHAEVAGRNLIRAGVADKVDILVGPAVDHLRSLIDNGAEPFGFVFVDADKPAYPEYFELVMQLTRPGSVVVFDNVVREGEVCDPDSADERVQGVRELFRLLKASRRITMTAQQTVGVKGHDGIAIGVVTAD